MGKLSEKAKCLWAKKRRGSAENSNLENKWLPLYIHLGDTAEVMELLWQEWLRDSVKENICMGFEKELQKEEMLKVLRFLGAVHDLGKATPAFQSRIISDASGTDKQILRRLEKNGVPLSRNIIMPVKHAEAGYTILMEEGSKVIRNLASVIGAHHGLPTDKGARSRNGLSASYYLDDEGEKIWKPLQQEFIQYALEYADIKELKDLPVPSMEIQVWMCGLLIMADWIASNEAYFPLIPADCITSESSRERLDACREKLAFLKKGWRFTDRYMDTAKFDFGERFGFAPNELQQMAVETVCEMKKPGIIVIEAEMGKGKTEAALAASDILARKFGRSGIFFALPSQATSDGMFGRLERFAASYHMPSSIRLMHGKAAYNEEYNRLAATGIEADSREGSVQIEEWFSGRKQALLADFVVGTIDQLLMTGLQQKHVMLRHLGLTNKVVIVDEVHAYDAFMNEYLKCALAWLGVYHVPVILLSATLPESKKTELIQAYNNANNNGHFQPRLHTLPEITYSEEGIIRIQAVSTKSESRTVWIDYEQEETLIELIGGRLTEKGCVGIIVNTVVRAQKIYEIICRRFPEIETDLLHSGFLVKDRLECEKRIRLKLGKPTDPKVRRPDKYIVVGTQVLEQSLDIDFDWLITDLAPVDLLLQRIGRLHRHARRRPLGFDQARCTILELPDDRKNPSELIYGEYLLHRTKEILQEKIMIPDDMPSLVEAVYDNENFDRELIKWKNSEEIKKAKPESFMIHRPAPERHRFRYYMPDFMKSDLAKLNDGENGEARVRDTAGAVEIVALQKKDEAFYLLTSGQRIDLTKQESFKELSAETLKLPYRVSNPGMIAHTLAALKTEQESIPAVFKDNAWLKGKYLLMFDQKAQATLKIHDKQYLFKYDKHIGITVRGEE